MVIEKLNLSGDFQRYVIICCAYHSCGAIAPDDGGHLQRVLSRSQVVQGILTQAGTAPEWSLLLIQEAQAFFLRRISRAVRPSRLRVAVPGSGTARPVKVRLPLL